MSISKGWLITIRPRTFKGGLAHYPQMGGGTALWQSCALRGERLLFQRVALCGVNIKEPASLFLAGSLTLAQQSAVLHPSGIDTPQPFQSRIEMQNSTLKNQLLQLLSDQVFQYTSHGYFKLTQSYGIAPSMSRHGNSYDNALAESFFGVLKMGCIYRHKPKTLKEANEMIDQYIHFYNHERIQLKIGVAPLTLRHSA